MKFMNLIRIDPLLLISANGGFWILETNFFLGVTKGWDD